MNICVIIGILLFHLERSICSQEEEKMMSNGEVQPPDHLTAMLFAISPQTYEELFHTFAVAHAVSKSHTPSGGIFLDRAGNVHALSPGDYISIADIGAFLVFLAASIDASGRTETFEPMISKILSEQFQPEELEALVSLCCFHERISGSDIVGDQVYVIGEGKDDDEALLAEPFEERCLLHAHGVQRVILALGLYLAFREHVRDSIDQFLTKYREKHEA
jgi:hypothetical protein